MEKYKIQKTIGSGSFANVSKAINIKTNETVAIKKMKKKFSSWDECLNLREIKSLTKLNHPNIMKLKEVIRVNDELFCVFEYCDQNIYQYYLSYKESGQSIPETLIRQILYQTASGLAYMHKHGFFHRDLKPENILYSKGIIKIGDFGLAREIRSRPPYTDYVATRWYRAPEILLKSTNYNSPVDIYALGCILAELYLLNPLFSGSSEIDQMHKICSILGTPSTGIWSEGHRLASQIGFNFPHYQPISLNNIFNNASPEAIYLIGQMLSFDPSKRPTALQILQHSFLTGMAALYNNNHLTVNNSTAIEKKRNKSLENQEKISQNSQKHIENDEEELNLVKKEQITVKKPYEEYKNDAFFETNEVWKGENDIDFISEEKKKQLYIEKKPEEQKIELSTKAFLIKDKEKTISLSTNFPENNENKRIFTIYDEEIHVENEYPPTPNINTEENHEEDDEDEIKLESQPLYLPSHLSKNTIKAPENIKNIGDFNKNLENTYINSKNLNKNTENRNISLERKEKGLSTITNNREVNKNFSIGKEKNSNYLEKSTNFEKNTFFDKNTMIFEKNQDFDKKSNFIDKNLNDNNIFLPKLKATMVGKDTDNKNQKISQNPGLPSFEMSNNLLMKCQKIDKNDVNREKNMKLPNLTISNNINGISLKPAANNSNRYNNINMPSLAQKGLNVSPSKLVKGDDDGMVYIGKYKM